MLNYQTHIFGKNKSEKVLALASLVTTVIGAFCVQVVSCSVQ